MAIVITTVLMTACTSGTKVETKFVDRTGVICEVIEKPLDSHMRTVVKNGNVILNIGADEVIVTATELSDTYETACS